MSKIRGGGPHANAHADAKAEASDSSALAQQKHNKKGTIDTLQNKLVGLVRKSGPRGDKHSSGGAARGSSQASGGSRDARSSTSSNPATSRHPSFVGDIGDPEMTIQEETVAKIATAPAETGALKLWRSGTLGYTDTIEDQFYDLGSTDYPELANVSAEDLPDLPSLLQRLRQGDVYRQVLVVDYDTDAHLLELGAQAVDKLSEFRTVLSKAKALAALVANHLGGQRESHDALHASWEESRRKAASVVTYMGSPMAVSTVRHRALLFKLLSRLVGLKCRLESTQFVRAEGAPRQEELACLVLFQGQQFELDLVVRPGEVQLNASELDSSVDVATSRGFTQSSAGAWTWGDSLTPAGLSPVESWLSRDGAASAATAEPRVRAPSVKLRRWSSPGSTTLTEASDAHALSALQFAGSGWAPRLTIPEHMAMAHAPGRKTHLKSLLLQTPGMKSMHRKMKRASVESDASFTSLPEGSTRFEEDLDSPSEMTSSNDGRTPTHRFTFMNSVDSEGRSTVMSNTYDYSVEPVSPVKEQYSEGYNPYLGKNVGASPARHGTPSAALDSDPRHLVGLEEIDKVVGARSQMDQVQGEATYDRVKEWVPLQSDNRAAADPPPSSSIAPAKRAAIIKASPEASEASCSIWDSSGSSVSGSVSREGSGPRNKLASKQHMARKGEKWFHSKMGGRPLGGMMPDGERRGASLDGGPGALAAMKGKSVVPVPEMGAGVGFRDKRWLNASGVEAEGNAREGRAPGSRARPGAAGPPSDPESPVLSPEPRPESSSGGAPRMADLRRWESMESVDSLVSAFGEGESPHADDGAGGQCHPLASMAHVTLRDRGRHSMDVSAYRTAPEERVRRDSHTGSVMSDWSEDTPSVPGMQWGASPSNPRLLATLSCATSSTGTSLLDVQRTGSLPGSHDGGRPQAGEGRLRRQSLGDIGLTVIGDPSLAEHECKFSDISMHEVIGMGAFGKVYKAVWMGTDVAVKDFSCQQVTESLLEDFRSEALLMRNLRHPNIMLFMGVVTKPPQLAIVSEYLPRGSLFRLLHPHKHGVHHGLHERRRLKMALDVARAMQYMHSVNVVHCDLKTGNLLVDKNWVVKVCDFGLSRVKKGRFLSGPCKCGTPEWSAPEMLRGDPVTETCDVYSFGVVLWELVTGLHPWKGMKEKEVVQAVVRDGRQLDIPAHLAESPVGNILKACLEHEPTKRPAFSHIVGSLRKLVKQYELAEQAEEDDRGRRSSLPCLEPSGRGIPVDPTNRRRTYDQGSSGRPRSNRSGLKVMISSQTLDVQQRTQSWSSAPESRLGRRRISGGSIPQAGGVGGLPADRAPRAKPEGGNRTSSGPGPSPLASVSNASKPFVIDELDRGNPQAESGEQDSVLMDDSLTAEQRDRGHVGLSDFSYARSLPEHSLLESAMNSRSSNNSSPSVSSSITSAEALTTQSARVITAAAYMPQSPLRRVSYANDEEKP
eukprot:CAMPEP_0114241106 /NCGR_PEP_ID=MMETSP0058-20121206/9460_1 /TAXON_ID=36894 /ORGANISM="Pyramimonas parkeae, CCMP726" /LENGTH=1456 /DNA_ID=CAMNT_0001353619 /DNA_START=116 /DNA_END=4486 /DNA_ORIENTATION=+